MIVKNIANLYVKSNDSIQITVVIGVKGKIRTNWYDRKKITMKLALIRKNDISELKKNGCSICGYNKCRNALSFHHVIPAQKLFNLESGSMCRNSDKIIDEFHKCILLCANCHREIHEVVRNG